MFMPTDLYKKGIVYATSAIKSMLKIATADVYSFTQSLTAHIIPTVKSPRCYNRGVKIKQHAGRLKDGYSSKKMLI
jgi:hypothetical protein